MGALARYGSAEAARRSYDTLSGGQKARLEILCLEGTVVAVSHDRAFPRRLDPFLMVLHDGHVVALPDHDRALEALTGGE